MCIGGKYILVSQIYHNWQNYAQLPRTELFFHSRVACNGRFIRKQNVPMIIIIIIIIVISEEIWKYVPVLVKLHFKLVQQEELQKKNKQSSAPKFNFSYSLKLCKLFYGNVYLKIVQLPIQIPLPPTFGIKFMLCRLELDFTNFPALSSSLTVRAKECKGGQVQRSSVDNVNPSLAS